MHRKGKTTHGQNMAQYSIVSLIVNAWSLFKLPYASLVTTLSLRLTALFNTDR